MSKNDWWPRGGFYGPRVDEVVNRTADLHDPEFVARLAGALADQVGCTRSVIDAVVRLILADCDVYDTKAIARARVEASVINDVLARYEAKPMEKP